MDSSTWIGDIGILEMILNYMLGDELRPYTGVDVSGLLILIPVQTRLSLGNGR